MFSKVSAHTESTRIHWQPLESWDEKVELLALYRVWRAHHIWRRGTVSFTINLQERELVYRTDLAAMWLSSICHSHLCPNGTKLEICLQWAVIVRYAAWNPSTSAILCFKIMLQHNSHKPSTKTLFSLFLILNMHTWTFKPGGPPRQPSDLYANRSDNWSTFI